VREKQKRNLPASVVKGGPQKKKKKNWVRNLKKSRRGKFTDRAFGLGTLGEETAGGLKKNGKAACGP